jgi:hypothetical protein
LALLELFEIVNELEDQSQSDTLASEALTLLEHSKYAGHAW